MGEKEGYLPFPRSFETICIHNSQDPNQWISKAVVPHIVPTTVFKIGDPRLPLKYTYSRFGNPNRTILERTLTAINKAKYGLCFASGISALTAILSALKHGGHIVSCEDVSPETYEVFNNVAPNYGICATFTDVNHMENLCSAIRDNTKLIWVENPTYTTLKVADLCTIANVARNAKILLGVDNTFLTPYLQRPLDFGANIIMQSMTKYINGHSDVIMGCICTNDRELSDQLQLMQVASGLNPSPIDCYQVLRGLKTLNLRMDQYLKNSVTLANYLRQHPAVEKVIHPGLKTHPQHDLLKTQASGHSGILSFYLRGDLAQCEKFLKHLKVFTVAEMCGGVESTIQIPFTMSHKHWKRDTKKRLMISENLIRLSVGLENICDLICDIESALEVFKQEPNCQ
ncbi:hypothetical protein NQ315_011886 [Exocentrus adspersus]|uniref:cystathionine gamma-lyase n=1 Tax=Exocentrus adspersus TaxID=1586481 RepID=A0AAV8W2E6_9CUCU|nr:hypothetical protein NQ315_011886 [Exocentrus adspersus]